MPSAPLRMSWSKRCHLGGLEPGLWKQNKHVDPMVFFYMSWYVQILKLTMMDEPWRCQNRLFYSCWGCGQRAGSPAPEWLTSRWWWVASTKKCDRLYACDVLDNCLDLQGMMLGMFKIVQVFFDFRPWALEWEIICGDEGANQHMKSTYAGKCQVSHP